MEEAAPDSDLPQHVEPLQTPERAVLYARLVKEHHAGTRKFKSVAQFHAAYLELGGTPRRKSVGKDRLNAGRKVGRKHNRLSWAQRNAMERACVNGTARLASDGRADLYPSASVNNRHGMEGQASSAAQALALPRNNHWEAPTGRHRLGPGPPGRSKGCRHYVKIANRPVQAEEI